MHSKSVLCAISLKCFYGYIILFLDSELTPLECSVDSSIPPEMDSSPTALLCKCHANVCSSISGIYPHKPQGGAIPFFRGRPQTALLKRTDCIWAQTETL